MLLLMRTSGNIRFGLSVYVGSWIKGSLHFAHGELLKHFLLMKVVNVGIAEAGYFKSVVSKRLLPLLFNLTS